MEHLPWSWYHWKALKGAPSWFHNILIMVEKLLNIEQFFTKFFIEMKIKKEFECTPNIVGKPFMNRI
jgi:hypothetical protein